MNRRTLIVTALISLLCLGGVGWLVFDVLLEDDSGTTSTFFEESELFSDIPRETFPEDSLSELEFGLPDEPPIEREAHTAPEVVSKEQTDQVKSENTSPALLNRVTVAMGHVEVLVTELAGQAAEGAVVRLFLGQIGDGDVEIAFKETDVDGRVFFESVPVGSCSVEVEASELSDAESDGRPFESFRVEAKKTVTIRLSLDSFDKLLSGRVLDREGRGVAEIAVFARPYARRGEPRLLMEKSATPGAVTDEDGAFVLRGLFDGEYVVQTRPQNGFGSEKLNVRVPSENVRIIIYREKKLVVRGEVTDIDSGEPLSHVLVSSSLGGMARRSREDGSYEIETRWREALRAGVALTARKDGYVSGEEFLQDGDTTETEDEGGKFYLETRVDFQLDPLYETGMIRGTLLDEDGEPVGRERVFLHSADREVRYSAITSADGLFVIKEAAVSDDYRLWVYPKQAFKDHEEEPIEVVEGENALEVELESFGTGTLEGVLVNVAGQALSSFAFRVRSMDSLANQRSVTTDHEGHFRVEDVPSGSLLLESHALPKVSVRGIVLDEDDELSLKVPVGFGDYDIKGVVTGPSGNPVSGARVILTWVRQEGDLRSQLQNESVSDFEGKFSVTGFGAGRVHVHVRLSGFQSLSRTVKADSDAARELTLRLKKGPINSRGKGPK